MLSIKTAIAIVCAATVMCGFVDGTGRNPVDASTAAASYSRPAVEQCLVKRRAFASSHPLKRLIPALRVIPGMTGAITIVPTPIPGARLDGPTLDGAVLAFMTTHADAVHALPALANQFIFYKGQPAIIHSMHPSPPKSDVPNLEDVYGNVAVIWEYPMKHPSGSRRLLKTCLAGT